MTACHLCRGPVDFRLPCPDRPCPAGGAHALCEDCFFSLPDGWGWDRQYPLLRACPLRDADAVARALMGDSP